MKAIVALVLPINYSKEVLTVVSISEAADPDLRHVIGRDDHLDQWHPSIRFNHVENSDLHLRPPPNIV